MEIGIKCHIYKSFLRMYKGLFEKSFNVVQKFSFMFVDYDEKYKEVIEIQMILSHLLTSTTKSHTVQSVSG